MTIGDPSDHYRGFDGMAPSLLAHASWQIDAGTTQELFIAPLHIAVAGKDAGLVRHLLAAGADVQQTAMTCSEILTGPPLHIAMVTEASPALLDILLEAGADPQARNEAAISMYGKAPLRSYPLTCDPDIRSAFRSVPRLRALLRRAADPTIASTAFPAGDPARQAICQAWEQAWQDNAARPERRAAMLDHLTSLLVTDSDLASWAASQLAAIGAQNVAKQPATRSSAEAP